MKDEINNKYINKLLNNNIIIIYFDYSLHYTIQNGLYSKIENIN